MKTKPWTAPVASNAEPSVVGFTLDMPCYLSSNDGEYIGPHPLMVCMLQGLRLAQMGCPFEIKSEDVRLLKFKEGTVWGPQAMINTFLASNNLATEIFEEIEQAAKNSLRNDNILKNN